MKPYKILIFILFVAAFCLALAYLFPKNGIKIGSGFTLNFHWTADELFQKAPEYADITEIIEDNIGATTDTINIAPIVEEPKVDTIRANVTILRKKVQPIEYPAGDSSALFTFFTKLDKCQTKRVRVMHYGDSQIEGDRITGYLRNRFQRQFGGSGPGLMPIVPGHAESASIIHQASGNWVKHSVYYKKDTILPHRKFGLLGSFARFTTYQSDSLASDTITHEATLSFSRSGMAYSSVRDFTECRIFYGHCNQPFTVKGFIEDSLTWFEEIDTTQSTQSFKWSMQHPPRDFKIAFSGKQSPDIYGIALDAPNGVSVDNLPFRGSSGIEFTRLNYSQLRQMKQQLNPGLVILEFGVNVVPYQVKSFKFYERALTRQLKYLKYVMPNASLLVIGVSDMSQRSGNYYTSYSTVEKIRNAQKNAAKNAGCAFWDLYLAMGGKNSMPSWVFAHPPLAQKDFIHFNRKGGHIVAQMFYNALMQEYQKFKINTSEQEASK